MLDKLITNRVCWYNILYQILSVAWTNRITTCAIATRMDTASHKSRMIWRLTTWFGREDIVQRHVILLSPVWWYNILYQTCYFSYFQRKTYLMLDKLLYYLLVSVILLNTFHIPTNKLDIQLRHVLVW